MGSNNSTRRVSFEADENDNVTIVKGIRLSENLINRMRGTTPSEFQQPSRVSTPPSAVQHLAPLLPQPAPFETTVPVVAPPSFSEPLAHLSTGDEVELRKKIAEELQTGLEEQRRKTELEQHKSLDEEKTKMQVQQQVKKILEAEQTAQENLKQALLKERVTAEEHQLQAQFYAQQLKERDQELRKQEAFYIDQLAKLEERNAEFYRVTMENYHRTTEVVSSRFKRYEISSICADLQGQVLECYKANLGQTLTCSNIASQYLQCVNNAKQIKMRTGG